MQTICCNHEGQNIFSLVEGYFENFVFLALVKTVTSTAEGLRPLLSNMKCTVTSFVVMICLDLLILSILKETMRLNFITEHCFEAVRMFTLPTHWDHSIPKWTVLRHPFHLKQDSQLETASLCHMMKI